MSSQPTGLLRSNLCRQSQLESVEFQHWAERLHEKPMRLHRKVWEYCYIVQALYERGMLAPGKRGLGFAVGQEPLPALFASMGCSILATDLSPLDPTASSWTLTGQHAESSEVLNSRGICDPLLFERNVTFQYLDMRQLPGDLGSFDFIWSACSAEHLGSLRLGTRFLVQSLCYLKSDGVAVHTVEYNVQSNWRTMAKGAVVLFRKRDLRALRSQVRGKGFDIDLDLTEGRQPADLVADNPPYDGEIHLRLNLSGFVASSFGLIIERRKHNAG